MVGYTFMEKKKTVHLWPKKKKWDHIWKAFPPTSSVTPLNITIGEDRVLDLLSTIQLASSKIITRQQMGNTHVGTTGTGASS